MIARIELKDGTVLKGNKYINEMLQRCSLYGDFTGEVAVITSPAMDGTWPQLIPCEGTRH